MAAPRANTPVWTQGTGIPMAWAITRSCVVARIQMPYFPRWRKSQRSPIRDADRTAIRIRYQGYSSWKSRKCPVTGSWILRATGPYCQRA